MIPNGERWHYLAGLLRRISSKDNGNFSCLNYFHFFAAENKCESFKKVYKN